MCLFGNDAKFLGLREIHGIIPIGARSPQATQSLSGAHTLRSPSAFRTALFIGFLPFKIWLR